MQATVHNLAGKQVDTVELDDAIFGITPNMGVIHRAVLRQQANARQGTHDTKTRADVRGGGKKPWRQKGTGRARQGSTRSPQWRHGGVVFGPHPRSYEQDMPRKMRRLAIRSVLSGKAADGQIIIVDNFDDLEPRTKTMLEVLNNLNIGKESALIFTAQPEDNLAKAAGNLPNVRILSAHLLSIVDMLKHTYVVMPRAALDVVNGILSSTGGRRKLALRGVALNGHTATETAPAAETAAEEAPAKKAPAKPSAKASAKAPAKAPAKKAQAEKAAEPVAAEADEPAAKPAGTGKAAKGKAAAKASITISNVQYSGDEYVEIENSGGSAADLGNWVLRDKNDVEQQYTFPEGTSLEAGATLQVFTKPGSTYSFNSKRPIWNDKGDALELLDAGGDVVSDYAYGTYADESEG